MKNRRNGGTHETEMTQSIYAHEPVRYHINWTRRCGSARGMTRGKRT